VKKKKGNSLKAAARVPIYSNCTMLSPEGLPMSKCSEKKARWYLKRGFADLISDNPIVFKLRFKPNGPGWYGDEFYLGDKENRCVVCGNYNDLTKHHTVPNCFRKHFPMHIKQHSSHDILPLCLECHITYESHALRLKNQILSEHNVRVEKPNESLLYMQKIASALKKHREIIPTFRVNHLENLLIEYYKTEESIDILVDKTLKECPDAGQSERWRDLVNTIDDLYGFCQLWRQHFVETMNPQYLPNGWRVDRELTRDDALKSRRSIA
jgi:exonuclease 3'-5' domain-containing protein 2